MATWPRINAVFYSEPVPPSLRTLTLLALVFDRVYFPGVYIPSSGLDENATKAEIQRISSLGTKDQYDAQLLNCMVYALNARHLADSCDFTGEYGGAGKLEDATEQLTKEFEELYFGPPREDFVPVYRMGFAKSLPGDERAAINGPSWLSYPPNALLFASSRGLVLVNDDPSLPVPGIGGTSLKSDAQVLATIMAFESIRLVLPNLNALSFEEIAEFREQTKEIVKPFRLAMLSMSKELNSAILSDASLSDVHREAKFLAETTVLPKVEELRRIIEEPARPWYRRVVDVTKRLPELVGNFATMPNTLATAKVLAALAEIFADLRDEQLEKQGLVKCGAYHYLLKIENFAQ